MTAGRRGRPKLVDHGTVRREFNWMDVTCLNRGTRYCTVTWMRHGNLISACAQYRNLEGVDMSYVGMAHGLVDGHFYEIGAGRCLDIAEAIGRQPATQYDSIEAAVAVSVLSLERAVSRAAIGDVDEDDHPWRLEGRQEYENRKAVRS